jgi:hypothetical protein
MKFNQQILRRQLNSIKNHLGRHAVNFGNKFVRGYATARRALTDVDYGLTQAKDIANVAAPAGSVLFPQAAPVLLGVAGALNTYDAIRNKVVDTGAPKVADQAVNQLSKQLKNKK